MSDEPQRTHGRASYKAKGDRINRLCMEEHIKPAELARRVHVTPRAVSNWLASGSIDVALARELSEMFGVPFDEIAELRVDAEPVARDVTPNLLALLDAQQVRLNSLETDAKAAARGMRHLVKRLTTGEEAVL